MNKLEKKFNLIDASFRMIEANGWDAFTFQRLSEKNKISLKKIKEKFKSKNALLKEFSKMIDSKVEKNFDLNDMEKTSIKDNLFELIMLRLELMRPYRKALKKVLLSFKKKPLMIKSVSSSVSNSIDFYLELTNAYDKSIFDFFKKKSMLLIYSYIFTIWLQDDSEELSKTMSELDRLLSLAEKVALNFKNFTPF